MNVGKPLQLACLAAVLSAGLTVCNSVAPVQLGAPQTVLAGAQELSTAFQVVSETVGPAVVSVRTYEQRSRGRSLRQTLQGSGVIVREEGIVVTNNHVVEGGDRVRVMLANGELLDTAVLGTDSDTDLAVLRIVKPGKYPYAELANDRDARVGEWVLAMGNPRGIGHTVTAGIISGLGRSDLDIANFEDFLQTDAAINKGNSGGPLIDLEGRVLGINTAVGTRYDGSTGIGFAIPAYMVHHVVSDIVELGRVQRGWLGIQMGQISNTRAQSLGYEGAGRVAVDVVIENSPAERAGLEPGDVIHSIDGRTPRVRNELLTAIATIEPGTEVQVVVWRDGAKVELPVTLTDRNAPVY